MLRISYRFTLTLIALAAAAFGAGCEGDDVSSVELSGRATFPPEFRTSLGEITPVSTAPFQVLDLSLPAGSDVVATGVTGTDGSYFARINPTPSTAVVVLGEIRVSGLIDPRDGSVSKDFNGITDVACQAGVTAVRDGSISALQLDDQRIANLEAGAAVVLSQNDVDFTDGDGSRAAAANLVRQITNDGANAPS